GVNVSSSGLFGYFSFEAIEHFEDIQLQAKQDERRAIPELQYHVYRIVIAIDHFRNQLHLFENLLDGEQSEQERLQFLIQNKNFPEYSFEIKGEERSNMSDQDFINLVLKMKEHIQRGDVFQIVPSRA